MPHTRHTRREFCVQACQFASLAGVGSLLASCGGSPGSSADIGSSLPVLNATRTNGVVTLTIDAGSALASVGGMALVQASGTPFLVARTSQDACTVLTAICTHQMCTVSNVSSGVYVCPCHGSEFDPAGHVVRGPAAIALHQFPSELANGVLTING